MALPFLDLATYGQEVRYLGEGSFGHVDATDLGYAIKKITTDDRLPNYSALHEIVGTLRLDSPHVIPLVDVMMTPQVTTLVYPLATSTLKDLMMAATLVPSELDGIILSLISGLLDIHNAGLLHLDMKPENILFSNEGKVWIGDFGLVEIYACALPAITGKTFTVPYEAPEIILGGPITDKADIWSLGVVIAEIFLSSRAQKKINFIDEVTEEDAIGRIFTLLGTPDELSWPGVSQLPRWESLQSSTSSPSSLRSYLEEYNLSQDEIGLLEFILVLDPDQRPDLIQILEHPYFSLQTQDKIRLSCQESLDQAAHYPDNAWPQLEIRHQVIQALIAVIHRLNLDYVHLALGVYLLDRMMTFKEILPDDYLVYGLAGVQLSSLTYEEGMAEEVDSDQPKLIPLIHALTEEMRGGHSTEEIIDACYDILMTTSFDLVPATPYHFLSLVLKEKEEVSLGLALWRYSLLTNFHFNPPQEVAEALLNLADRQAIISETGKLLAQEILMSEHDPLDEVIIYLRDKLLVE